MGNCKDFIRKCIENCRCNGELNTASAAEVLVKKLSEYLDEYGAGSGSIPSHAQWIRANVGGTREKLIADAAHCIEYDIPAMIIYKDANGNEYKLYCTEFNRLTEQSTSWEICHPILVATSTNGGPFTRENALMDRLYLKFDADGVISDESFIKYPWQFYLASDSANSKVFKIEVDASGNLTATEV